ncbi:TPA: hypothetical protein DCW56_02015 [Candidatus Peregrinibacteria bacterium]|nr:hypothetical protein [Candidatus Peregrinibacteria bacterium]
MLADPCELWASDSFGSGCMLSAKLTYYQSKLMGQLQVCVQKEFPKTNSPAQDTCLRDRAIEGWLRAGLVNLSVTEDIKSTDEIVTPENLITEARKSLDECGKRNP